LANPAHKFPAGHVETIYARVIPHARGKFMCGAKVGKNSIFIKSVRETLLAPFFLFFTC